MVKVVKTTPSTHPVVDAETRVLVPKHAVTGRVESVKPSSINIIAKVVNTLVLGNQIGGRSNTSDQIKENTSILFGGERERKDSITLHTPSFPTTHLCLQVISAIDWTS